MGKLMVAKVSMLATIQDRGRFGFRQYGIPQSGAMDQDALFRANELVGNATTSPAIEVAMGTAVFEAKEASIVAISGALCSIQIDKEEVKANTSYLLMKGDSLIIRVLDQGVYAYLAIGGELQAQKQFGSYSTYLMAGFGGLDGRALKKGDELITQNQTEYQVRNMEVEDIASQGIETIQIMRGPEWRMLKDLPTRPVYTIESSSNRMGMRLEGPPLSTDGMDILSSAVIPGIIQLPPDGNPIILMNDCQTTGGYPRIGKVLEKEMGRLAQMRPGSKIQFELIT